MAKESSLTIKVPLKKQWKAIEISPIEAYRNMIEAIECDYESAKELVRYAHHLYWENQKDKLDVIIDKIHSVDNGIIVPILKEFLLSSSYNNMNSGFFTTLEIALINPNDPPEELADYLINLFFANNNCNDKISEILNAYPINMIAPKIYAKTNGIEFATSGTLATCSRIMAKWNQQEEKTSWYRSLIKCRKNIHWIQDELVEVLPDEALDYFIEELSKEECDHEIWKRIIKIKPEILVDKIDKLFELINKHKQHIKPSGLTNALGVDLMRKYVDKYRKNSLKNILEIQRKLTIELTKTKSLPVIKYIAQKSVDFNEASHNWIFWENYYRKINSSVEKSESIK